MNRKNPENETVKSNSQKKSKSNIKKNSLMNSGKTVLGVLIGIGVGALIGIALAPQKGSKTRRKLIKKGENFFDDMRNQFDVFLNDSADKIEKLGKEKDQLVEKEKALITDVKNGIKTAVG